MDMFEAAAKQMALEDQASRDISETIVKKAAPRSARAPSSGFAAEDVTERLKNPENIAKAAVAAAVASVVAALSTDAASAAAGVGLGVLVVKALEALARDPNTTSVSFGDSVKSDLKPFMDKLPKDFDTEKLTKQASSAGSAIFERARGVADSFDEVFGGMSDGIRFGGKVEAETSVEPAQVAAPAPVEAPKKPVEASKPVELPKKSAELPKKPEPVAAVPELVAVGATAKREDNWSNSLLTVKYSEQIIEDIRIMDANAVERANAKRLGYDFTPVEPRKMPETEYTWSATEISVSKTEVLVSTTDTSGAQPGEVIKTLNEADDGYSSFRNRTRQALGLPQIEENSQEKTMEEKPTTSFWQRSVMGLLVKFLTFAAFIALAFFVRRSLLA